MDGPAPTPESVAPEPTPVASTSTASAPAGKFPITRELRTRPPSASALLLSISDGHEANSNLVLNAAAPTPYHPYVHLPLLKFAPSTPGAAGEPNPSKLVVPLPSPLFNTASRPSLLHKLVVSHLASLRAGTASTKNRSEVNFSGKKIRPQKGTGGARLGSRGSPMLTGGGRAFGPRPKGPDGWRMKVNRKEERLGLRVALSEKWRAGDLAVVDRLAVASEPSTRKLTAQLGSRDWRDALFILAADEISRPLGSTEAWEAHLFELSAGNLPGVAVVSELAKLGTWDVVRRRKVVVELDALDALCERLDPDNVLGYGDEELEFEEGEEEWLAEEAEGLEEELVKAGIAPV